jgi:AraC-like DNA-binding protein
MDGREQQSYVERPVPGPLSAYASCIWIQRIEADGPAYVHRTVPNGSVELCCPVGGSAQIVGPHTGPRVGTLRPGTEVVGIRLRPGAAATVLGIAAHELRDASVGADDVWGAPGIRLAERIAAAPTVDDAAGLLADAVTERVGEADETDPTVAEAVDRIQAGAASDLASSLWISERHLRRRLATTVGFGARTLSRILRYQRFLALSQTATGRDLPLSDLAAAAGYADQAHLTRESTRLSGLPPAAFLASMREQCGPSHDHRPSYAPLVRAAWRRRRTA